MSGLALCMLLAHATSARTPPSYGCIAYRLRCVVNRSMTVTPCVPCKGSFLQLPGQTNIVLISSAEHLMTSRYNPANAATSWTCCAANLCYSSLVGTAYVCGIDAEWEPGLAAASATLLQLAFATCQPHKQCSTVLLLVSCFCYNKVSQVTP